MGQPTTILDWSGVLLPADGELSEQEIDTRYGVLIRDAVSAFRADPSYIVEMAETAALIRYKRELISARREARHENQCTNKEEIEILAQEILAARGVIVPVRTTTRLRNVA